MSDFKFMTKVVNMYKNFLIIIISSILCSSSYAVTYVDKHLQEKFPRLTYKRSDIYSLLRVILPSNSVILEAGANNGDDTFELSSIWTKGSVYAFEPSPKSFKRLQKAIKNKKNVKIFPYALSDTNGKIPFYVNNDNSGSSSLLERSKEAGKNFLNTAKIIVKSYTMDKWAEKNNIPKVDFMWLDMEGFELQALKKSENILKTTKVIFTEINFDEYWYGTTKYEELKRFLEERGFIEVWSEYAPGVQGDSLFIKKDYLLTLLNS